MIDLKNITVKFGNFTALHDININVKEGEFFTFLGPSGCGKTTTLRTITGFVNPVSGNVLMNNKDITNLPIEKRNIGIVFQSYALFPTMTVYNNIAFGLKIKKLSKEEIKNKVLAIARKVDLSEEQLQKAVSELSGGQQQRVAIARALVTEPDVICLDEPLSNLDAKLRLQLRNELKKMQKDFGITSIYVTHDQEEALTLSDRIAVFNHGCIEQIGTPNEIYNHSATEFVCNFIGDINALGEDTVRKMNEHGAGLNPGMHHYIRLERINVTGGNGNEKNTGNGGEDSIRSASNGSLFTLKGNVIASEYYGLYIKYTITTPTQVFKVIEKNDGNTPYNINDTVSLSFNARDIMSYNQGENAVRGGISSASESIKTSNGELSPSGGAKEADNA